MNIITTKNTEIFQSANILLGYEENLKKQRKEALAPVNDRLRKDLQPILLEAHIIALLGTALS